jgi:hypothetical protein
MKHKIHKSKLRFLFADTLRGVSIIENEKHGRIYIKHPNSLDSAGVDVEREAYLSEAKKSGAKTSDELLAKALENGTWSKEDDKKLNQLNDFVSRMEDTKRKLSKDEEIKQVESQIEKTVKKLNELISAKNEITQYSSELFAQKKVNEYYIFTTFYKDKAMTNPLFTEEDFDELDESEIKELVDIYNVHALRFEAINMQRVSISSFFLNLFYLSKDDPYVFYGSPIIRLTYRQIELFSHAQYFKQILSEMKVEPTEEELDNPQLLIDNYHAGKNASKIAEKSSEKGEQDGSSIVGATQNDNKRAGIKTKGSTLREKADKMGKTKLSKADLMKIHGVK